LQKVPMLPILLTSVLSWTFNTEDVKAIYDHMEKPTDEMSNTKLENVINQHSHIGPFELSQLKLAKKKGHQPSLSQFYADHAIVVESNDAKMIFKAQKANLTKVVFQPIDHRCAPSDVMATVTALSGRTYKQQTKFNSANPTVLSFSNSKPIRTVSVALAIKTEDKDCDLVIPKFSFE